MAFGISFGAKKTSGSSTSQLTKDETGWQSGLESTSGTRTGVQTSTGGTTNSTSGTSSTTGTTSQTQGSEGKTTTTGTTRALGTNITSGLEGAITSILSQVLDPNTGDRAMLTRGMDAMGGFDLDSYVNGTLQSAKAQQGTKLDEMLGSIFSNVGGTENTNSAAALLANRARGDAAANLAGIEAQARGQGAQILQGNLTAMSNAFAPFEALLPELAGVLKGAVTTTEQQSLVQQLEQLLGTTGSATTTAESGTQATTGSTTNTENLAQIVANLLQQSTHTTGTESTKTKGKEMGGGASLSF